MEKSPPSRFGPRRSTALAALAALTLGPALLLPLVASRAEPPATIAEGGTPSSLAFNENRRTQTLEAKGRDVIVNGNRNEITLRGECHVLTVNGNGNRVTVEVVTSIVTPGNNNQVFWSKSARGEQPQIDNPGSANTVARRGE